MDLTVQGLFEHLFETSSDARLVICDNIIEIFNKKAAKLLSISSDNSQSSLAPFSRSPEFQPNGERSDKMSEKILLETSILGNARFEWLHLIDGEEVWTEYILDKIHYKGKDCVHASIREIGEYKALHLHTNQRIERLITQNQALTELSAMESDTGFSLEKFMSKLCMITADTLCARNVRIWKIDKDHRVNLAASNTLEDDKFQKIEKQFNIKEFPRFYKSLQEHQLLVINDAGKDVRINELRKIFLKGNDNKSAMIVAPLLNEGILHGYIWIECPGEIRKWELEERSFASSLGEMISKHIGAEQKQKTERILHKKEKLFKALIDHSLDVVCILNAKGVITYQSPSFESVLGFPKNTLVGKNSFDLIHPEDVKRLKFQFLKLAHKPNVKYTFTFKAQHRNGSWLYIEALARNQLTDREIEGIVVNFRDITERMAFQEQLRSKESYYRALIEKSMEVTTIRTVEGIATYISPSIETVFGIKVKDLINKTIFDLVYSDDLEHTRKDWEFILQNPGVPRKFERRIILPNGDIRFIEGTSRNLIDDNTINGVISNWRDTTAKRDAENALIESQMRLEGIISSAMDAIITVDNNQNIVLFNAAAEKMFDYPAFEIFGKSIGKLIPESKHEFQKEQMGSFKDTPVTTRKMNPVTDKPYILGVKSDGNNFPIDASISRQEIDNEIFYTSIVRDISEQIKSEDVLKNYSKNLEKEVKKRTRELKNKNDKLNSTLKELKNTQEQLVESEKIASLGQLTAGIAHEINNPINFVSSTISPLKRDFGEIREIINRKIENTSLANGNETVKEMKFLFSEISQLLNSIEEGAKRTKNIVLGLRNFSRMDENSFKKVNIHDGLDSTLMLLNSKLKGVISVEKEYGSLPPIECLPGKINQVFMNIILNAIQAIESKGTIKIKTSTNGKNTITISISDTGMGMTKATEKRIFEPFFTTKDVGIGTGLGLSITYGIIEDHSGTIEVKSKIGIGTTFVISLPVRQL